MRHVIPKPDGSPPRVDAPTESHLHRETSGPLVLIGGACTPDGEAMRAFIDLAVLLRTLGATRRMVATGVLLQTSPMSAMGFVDKNIRKPEDIKGKTVAITPADSMTQIWPLFLKKTGLKEGDFTTVAGDGRCRFRGDSGPAAAACAFSPVPPAPS